MKYIRQTQDGIYRIVCRLLLSQGVRLLWLGPDLALLSENPCKPRVKSIPKDNH